MDQAASGDVGKSLTQAIPHVLVLGRGDLRLGLNHVLGVGLHNFARCLQTGDGVILGSQLIELCHRVGGVELSLEG